MGQGFSGMESGARHQNESLLRQLGDHVKSPCPRKSRCLRIGLLAVLMAAFLSPVVHAERPRLAVVISVDQLPQEYLERMQEGFSTNGIFERIFREGAEYTNCHHGQAITSTGTGHSVMLTGSFPNASGIIDNTWFDRHANRVVYCVEDSAHHLMGALASEGGLSPRNLLVSTLGDSLKLANPDSRVFALGLKDRAVVLMGGHLADGAYWFDTKSGNWITSSYYHKQLPGFLRVLNESGAAEAHVGKSWKPLCDDSQYVHCGSSAATSLATWRHEMPAEAGVKYFESMTVSPFGNDLTLATARVLIESEHLGRHAAPDLLLVNLSSNDYVGHQFGPQSLEVQDMTFRLDRQLAEFADYIDTQVGVGNWVLALSSDHGIAPIPEHAADLGLPAGRNPLGDYESLAKKLEAVLVQELGPTDDGRRYIQHVDETSVYLQRGLPELRGDRFVQAQRVVRDALLDLPPVAAAFMRETLLAGNATDPLTLQFQRTFNGKRSGDVLYALTCFKVSGKKPAEHGSPWEYDNHIPMLLWGAGIRPGKYTASITPASIAPTIARLLGVDAPSACAVPPLDDALSRNGTPSTLAKAHSAPRSSE